MVNLPGFIVPYLLLLISHPLLTYSACPSGYGNEFTAGGTCYKLISSVSGSDAVTSCSTDGGWLGTIETSAEDTFIKSTFASTKIWIGFTYSAVEGG
jgi:hypothetical protein